MKPKTKMPAERHSEPAPATRPSRSFDPAGLADRTSGSPRTGCQRDRPTRRCDWSRIFVRASGSDLTAFSLDLEDALARLVDKGLIFRAGCLPRLPSCSSTPSCRTLPTLHFFGVRGGKFMHASRMQCWPQAPPAALRRRSSLCTCNRPSDLPKQSPTGRRLESNQFGERTIAKR